MSAGYTGGALSLSGSTYYSAASGLPNLPVGNSPYTIVLQIKMPTVCNTCGFLGWGTFASSNRVNAFRTSGTTLINYWWSNDLTSSSSTQFDGSWHQVAATYDGTTRKIYFDGVVKGSDSPTANSHAVPSNTAFNLGVTNGAEYYIGILDSVGIYSVALTAAQLAALR